MPIEVKSLSYIYSPKTPFECRALNGITLTINDGDFFGIVGSTGAGKSTLISHINALTRVGKNSGTVIVDGMDLSQKKIDFKKLRQTVGMVFQYPEYQLFEDTVRKDVAFGAKNVGLSGEQLDSAVRFAISLVGLDYDEIAERSPFELSGGQKRRVAIAGVLAMRPKILILDEPTAGLDPLGKREVLQLLHRIKAECPTIVLISHNMDEIAQNCNRIAVLDKGDLLGVFTPTELFSDKGVLDRTGLQPPLVTQIADKLNERGYHLPSAVIDEDELVRAILAEANHA